MSMPDYALPDRCDPRAADERRSRNRSFATSNKCLVEIDDCAGTSRAWLPTYEHRDWSDLDATDHATAALWRELGFEVTPPL